RAEPRRPRASGDARPAHATSVRGTANQTDRRSRRASSRFARYRNTREGKRRIRWRDDRAEALDTCLLRGRPARGGRPAVKHIGRYSANRLSWARHRELHALRRAGIALPADRQHFGKDGAGVARIDNAVIEYARRGGEHIHLAVEYADDLRLHRL